MSKGAKKRRRETRCAAILAVWAARWPELLHPEDPKPLAIGAGDTLLQASNPSNSSTSIIFNKIQ